MRGWRIRKVESPTFGSRGYLFTWNDPYRTNVYAINGDKHLFICDTFLGIEPMEEALKHLRGEGIGNPVVVFISHGDYDHYWGSVPEVSPFQFNTRFNH